MRLLKNPQKRDSGQRVHVSMCKKRSFEMLLLSWPQFTIFYPLQRRLNVNAVRFNNPRLGTAAFAFTASLLFGVTDVSRAA